MSSNDTTTYIFYSAEGEELHCGRTRRPLRYREREHQRRFEEPDGYAVPVDQTTWEAANEWERTRGCSPYNRTSGTNVDTDDTEENSGLTALAIFGGIVFGGLLLGALTSRT